MVDKKHEEKLVEFEGMYPELEKATDDLEKKVKLGEFLTGSQNK